MKAVFENQVSVVFLLLVLVFPILLAVSVLVAGVNGFVLPTADLHVLSPVTGGFPT